MLVLWQVRRVVRKTEIYSNKPNEEGYAVGDVLLELVVRDLLDECQ